MTSYRYIGYGVTDSNGVAHLDHDPQGNPINGYTGTGIGEVDIIASTSNPITSSSIVSVPLSVWDLKWYDDGVTNPKTVTWNASAGLGVTIDSGGTLLTTNTASNQTYAVNNGSTSYTTWIIEFDVVEINGYHAVQFGNDVTIRYDNQDVTANSHVKIENTGTELVLTVDGVTKTSVSHSRSNGYIRLLVGGNLTYKVKYKNFMLY